jgi:hypothetical protein
LRRSGRRIRRSKERQLQVEREEQEYRQRLEKARIDRLLDEAVSLRRAMDIRAYVDAVRAVVANETASILSEKMER